MTQWAKIVAQHGPIVWQTALRLLANEPDSADCFQETFLSAMHVAARQPIANWPGLLQRLATTRALDMLRKRILAQSRHDHVPDFTALAGPSPQPSDQLQNDELAEHLAKALAHLPAQQAEAYCLRHLNDFSYDQIAEELGISVDNVGVNLHRARSRLRELLHPVSLNPTNRGES